MTIAMIYFSKQGDVAKAIKIFEKYMKMDVEHKNLYRRFYFYLGALYMFTYINKETIKLALRNKVPFCNATNSYNVVALREGFNKETDAIAEMFNKRNGNKMMSGEKQELLAV